MSSYELTNRFPLSLMKGRLGIYEKNHPDPASLDGVDNQEIRLMMHGGSLQQERMIKDKRRSLDRAVWFSYQGADVLKVGEEGKPAKALINPNKLKQDYDDKIISIGFEHNYKPGDVFEWLGTNTHWLIYLQDLTELAYFRGDIRKCSFEIAWQDENGKTHSTFAALRGPVETKINYIQKHGISIDTPNLSLNILMPLTDATLEQFKRYSKFYIRNDTYPTPVCWRVEAIDWISTPGILEIAAVEYYANQTEDDLESGVVGGLIVQPVDPNPPTVEVKIEGETFIKPKKEYTFTYTGDLESTWTEIGRAHV